MIKGIVPVVRHWRRILPSDRDGKRMHSTQPKPWLPLEVVLPRVVKVLLLGVWYHDVRSAVFPSSAILEEMFPSDRDGDKIRRRYAISAISGVQMEKRRC